MGNLYFVANNFLAMLVSWQITGVLLAGRQQWKRHLAAVAGFPIVVLFVVLVQGVCGILSAFWALLFLLVIEIVTLFVTNRFASKNGHGHLPESFDGPELKSQTYLIFFVIVCGLASGIISGLFLFKGTHFGFDDLSYHASAVAHWIVDGKLSLAPRNYHAYYPFNAEVFSLWFALPFKSDGMVFLCGFYWYFIALFAIVSVGIVRGHSRIVILLTLMPLLLSPIIRNAARIFSAVDFAQSAMFLAAMAMAISPKKIFRKRIVDAVITGIFIGFAIGCKISCAPLCLVLLVWFLFDGRDEMSFRSRIRIAGVFLAGVFIAGSVWYIRNIIITGNPLFPAELAFWDGPFLTAQQNRTKLISWIIRSPFDLEQWNKLARGYVGWPIGLFILSFAGYITGFRICLSKKTPENAQQYRINLLFLCCGLLSLAVFPFTPFSGTTNSPDAGLFVGMHYVMTPIMIGFILLGQKYHQCSRKNICFIVFVAIMMISGKRNIDSMIVNLTIIGGVYIGYFTLRKLSPIIAVIINRRGILAVLFFSMLLGISLCKPVLQKRADERIFSYNKDRPVGHGWRLIEQLPEGSRIWQFGRSSYQYYPLFGRRYQFVPVPVNGVGIRRELLHKSWESDPLNTRFWKESKKNEYDYESLTNNLLETGVDYVLITSDNEGNWPIQKDILASSEKANIISQDKYNLVYKMLK